MEQPLLAAAAAAAVVIPVRARMGVYPVVLSEKSGETKSRESPAMCNHCWQTNAYV